MKTLFWAAALLCLLPWSPTPAQTFRWVKAGQGTSTDRSGWAYSTNGVAYANGRVAATGHFVQDLTLDNSTFSSLAGQSTNAFTGLWAANGTKQWLQAGGGFVVPPYVRALYQGTCVGLDAAGNAYATYQISGDAVFDNVSVSLSSGVCTVVVKYTPAGRVAWVRKLQGGEYVEVKSLAVTPTGGVVLGGAFTGSLTVGSQTINAGSISYGSQIGFVASYDAAGNGLWAQSFTADGSTFPSSATAQTDIKGVATDNAGNVVVIGRFSGTLTLGASTALVSYSQPPDYDLMHQSDVFVAKYTPQGSFIWGRQIGGPAYDTPTGITVDNTGHVVVIGTFGAAFGNTVRPPTVFGSTPGTPTGTLNNFVYGVISTGLHDGFVARYDAQGTLSWANRIWGADREGLFAAATSNQGDVYVSGTAFGGVWFDATTTLPAASFGYQGYVAKYNAAGALRWVQHHGGPGSNIGAGTALASDGNGHLFVGGAFQGSTTFGTIYASGSDPQIHYPYLAALDDNELVLSSRPSQAANQRLTVFPNPSTDQVQLRWPAGLRPTRLEVRDALGRLVRTELPAATETSRALHLSGLPAGVYLVQLQTADQRLTQRLVLE